jgi:hypothetical protein
MRVKITKTIDISDIATETRRMLDLIKSRIMYRLPDNMAKIIRTSLSNQGEEYFYTIDLINELRQELAAIDQDLGEISNIMDGHKSALSAETNPSSGERQPEPPPVVDNEIVERRKQQEEDFLKKYNEAMKDNTDFLESHGYELGTKSEQWLANEQAEYEKMMARTEDAEEGFDEEG